MNARFWNIFHDGSAVSVLGSVPGDLTLNIELPYIRERFPHPGNTFQLVLHNCTAICFHDYASGRNLVEPENFRTIDVEILSAAIKGDSMEVITSPGILKLTYDTESISIDDVNVSIDELERRANEAVAETLAQWRASGS